ncbi:MAG TPA: energy transducer TonB [Sedimenticola sp.]|nr:energy transducer TonB [Sedimenticola sp.]
MNQATVINPLDRLGLTLFFAATLHMALILGVGFDFNPSRPRMAERTLEVMVVHNPRKPKEPEEADFLAQTSQEGGGDQEEIVRPKTQPAPAPQPASPPAPVPAAAAKPKPKPPAPKPKKTIAAKKSPKKRPAKKTMLPVEQKLGSRPAAARAAVKKKKRITAAQLLASTNMEVKRLSAELDKKTKRYAKRPRRKAINASTKEYKYANYLDGWRRKVERIGNLNYPDEAKRRKLYGNLILHVAVRADGSVERIRVLRSSGHKLLDDAAVRIVKLAAPFAPFSAEIREETDILDITRTWRFLSSNRLDWNN